MTGRLLGLLYRGTALLFALVFLVTAWRGAMDLFVQRALFLLFALLLVFLGPLAKRGRLRPLETVLALLTVAGTAYVIAFHQSIAYQAGIATRGQLVLAALTVLIVLEATRRLIGWVLPALVLVMVGYAVLGWLIPGNWGHAGFSVQNVLGYVYLTPDGLWSLPVGVAATYIITFVVLGEFMQKAGISDLLTAVAMRVAGRVRGGPAQVSVVGSLAFGMVSGSAPANVAIDGAITIPLMKRYGFPAPVAGAIELASSAGGQLMPPVMGAAAFIMVELLRVRYVDVARAALVPALLYYLGVGASVYFLAGALGLRGLSRTELDEGFLRVRRALATRGHLLLPLLLLVYLVVAGWFAPRAAAVAVAATVLAAALHPQTRMRLRGVAAALSDGGVRTLDAAMGTACSALIFSMIVFTGIGVKFSTLAVQAAGGNVLVLLLLVVFATLMLGLALPTTASYLIAAATVAPALETVGIPPLAAHLFIFYYSVLATITPPEGMALFTASAIAGSNWMQTGLQGMKLTLSGYLVPFGFVFMPALILAGTATAAVVQIATVAAGLVFLSAAVVGHLGARLHPVERVLLIGGAALLFQPGVALSVGGLAVCAVVAARRLLSRAAGAPAAAPGRSG